jgi:hypothetical protein
MVGFTLLVGFEVITAVVMEANKKFWEELITYVGFEVFSAVVI